MAIARRATRCGINYHRNHRALVDLIKVVHQFRSSQAMSRRAASVIEPDSDG